MTSIAANSSALTKQFEHLTEHHLDQLVGNAPTTEMSLLYEAMRQEDIVSCNAALKVITDILISIQDIDKRETLKKRVCQRFRQASSRGIIDKELYKFTTKTIYRYEGRRKLASSYIFRIEKI
mgnify:CR=1 FL=1